MNIGFSIDETKILSSIPRTKVRAFSTLIPGDLNTYSFYEESAYRTQYQESWYAFTWKKGGWDCMRHYEIIANGCMPYFPGLDQCPQETMTLFPKEIVLEAMMLPGIDPVNHKIDFTVFPVHRYEELLQRLMDYAREHLTCRAMAKRVLDHFPGVKKVAFVSGDPTPDYQRCTLLTGFKRLLGRDCIAVVDVPHLYDDFPEGEVRVLYGRGFSYSRILPASVKTLAEDELGNVDLVIYGSYHRKLPDAFTTECENRVYICGEDIHKCNMLDLGKYVFVRELGDA